MAAHGLCTALIVASMLMTGCAGAAIPQASDVPSSPPAAQSQPAVLTAAAAYVDAVERRDLDALVASFAQDGAVVDVQRRIVGREAIREWAAREVIGGSLRIDAVSPVGPDSQRLRVHWAPLGSAGWAADYTFQVRGDEILEADLQYAR